MSETLTDPDKPAHAIIEVFEDGDAMRNDGVRLTAANKNPWYVLATVHGEQPKGASRLDHDEKLAADNRDIWNKLHRIVTSAEVIQNNPSGFLDRLDLSAQNRRKLVARLENCFPNNVIDFTQLGSKISFNTTYFPFAVCFMGFEIGSGIEFIGAHFADNAIFCGSQFRKSTYFIQTNFQGHADFRNTVFKQTVNFRAAAFDDAALFNSVEFAANSCFSASTFKRGVSFEQATFTEHTDFGPFDDRGENSLPVMFYGPVVFHKAK